MRRIRKYLIVIGVLVGIYVASMFYFEQWKLVIVSGSSMFNTLADGDITFGTKVEEVSNGDIYVIKEPDQGIYAIKRLIGSPGDLVELKDGITYRNGSQIMSNPGKSFDNRKWLLGPDEYLFLGDNREVSYDGRYWERMIHLNEILYHVDYRLYPISKTGRIE